MPIGNAVAINSATPLFMTLFAAWMLREHVGPLCWMAIMVGFIGVLLVLQPAAEGFNAWALLCLLVTLFNTARDLITRRIPTSVASLVVTLAAASSVTVISGLMSGVAVAGGKPHAVCVAGLRQPVPQHCLFPGDRGNAPRQGQRGGPFPLRVADLCVGDRMTGVGDVPNALAWIGIVLLVGAGLATLRRG